MLREAPGIIAVDEPENNVYPWRSTPPAKKRLLLAGSARTTPLPMECNLWVVADNLRKGAALNAVQIAEILIRDHL